jgi:hypothetical protein
LSKRIRKLEIECSLLSHPKSNKVKSHVPVLPGVPYGGIRNRVSVSVIVSDGQLTYPPVVLRESEVQVANELVVHAHWDGLSVYTVGAVACISSHLRQKSLEYIRVML